MPTLSYFRTLEMVPLLHGAFMYKQLQSSPIQSLPSPQQGPDLLLVGDNFNVGIYICCSWCLISGNLYIFPLFQLH